MLPLSTIALLFHVIDGHEQSQIWKDWISLEGSEKFLIYVHAKNGIIVDSQNFLSGQIMAKVLPTTRRKTQRAKNSLMQIALANQNVDLLVHLSSTCIPLQTPRRTYEELSLLQSNGPRSVFSFDECDWIKRLRKTVGQLCSPDIRSEAIVKHHEWIVLCRKHAQMIVDSDGGSLQKYLIEQSSTIDNETVPGSVLYHAGYAHEILNEEIHFADWSERRASPRSWKEIQMGDGLIYKLTDRNGKYLFARKFPSASNIGDFIQLIWDRA